MQNQTVQVKVQFNDELRRFSLPQLRVEEMEKTIKQIFKLPDRPFTLKFKDDEDDWVTFSTDAELIHAQQFLLAGPFRVMVVQDQRKCKKATKVGGERKKIRCQKTLKPKREAKSGNWRQDKMLAKKEFIDRRIGMMQARLQSAMNSNQARTLLWRLQKMQEKKEILELKLARIEQNNSGKVENPDNKLVVVVNPKTRRCRAFCKLPEETRAKLIELRNNLKAAKESGDKAKIGECRQQLIVFGQELKQARIAAAQQQQKPQEKPQKKILVVVEKKPEPKVEKVEEKVEPPQQRIPKCKRAPRVQSEKGTQNTRVKAQSAPKVEKFHRVPKVQNPVVQQTEVRVTPVQQQQVLVRKQMTIQQREALRAMRVANRNQRFAEKKARKEEILARKAARVTRK